MNEPRTVSNENIAAYGHLVTRLAWRYNGLGNAEFDDLFQEGQLAVFTALRNYARPSKDLVAKQMLKWVTKCRREGFSGYDVTEEGNEVLS